MKLELLDSYNIRARLCPSIILLGPIALTIFFCFEKIYNLSASAILIGMLLAFTNYIPILQRCIRKNEGNRINYAVKFLELEDSTIDSVSKNRYYKKLAEINDSFSLFKDPSNKPEFKACCKSAVIYLRNNTRDNHLVLEENINYGFCKNLLACQPLGIIICIILILFTAIYSICTANTFNDIPLQNWIAFVSDILFFIFWKFGITEEMLDQAARRYAFTLISAIDTFKVDNK
jgi:hypothetical protein